MNAAAETASQSLARAAQRMYWSIRRELWENRSLYIAPLVVGALVLLGFTFSLARLPQGVDELSSLRLDRGTAIEQPYIVAGYLLMGVTFILGVFYSLDALQGERRDRSLLFWKSLPISDLTTVLAKASVPLVILPLLSVVITVAIHLTMLLLSTVVLVATRHDAAILWTEVPFVRISLLLLYHMIAVHALSHAPLYGWLLLVSAWSRRAAFLWAVLPPLAIVGFERMAFNSMHTADFLMARLAGGMTGESAGGPGGVLDPQFMHVHVGAFFGSPGLWLGLVLAAALLVGAARLRRSSAPI